MNSTIQSVKENPLLDRKTVTLTVEHQDEPTPSEEDIQNRFAAENDIETDNITVKSIYTGYGKNTSKANLQITQDFEYSEELEEETTGTTQTEETTEPSEEYQEIVSGTITEAKDALNEMDEPDWKQALKAEKNNKNRTTLIDWLQNQSQ